MSRRKTDPIVEREVTTEEELQEKWSGHPSPFVQKVLRYRRNRLARGEKFLTVEEINRRVRQARDGE